MKSDIETAEPNCDKPSRTQKKKAALAAQALGEKLVLLKEVQMARLDLPDELREAVRACQKMTQHGARRRQLQYIGSLMRHIDTEQLRQHLENLKR